MRHIFAFLTYVFVFLILACVYWFFCTNYTRLESFFITLTLAVCPIITGVLAIMEDANERENY